MKGFPMLLLAALLVTGCAARQGGDLGGYDGVTDLYPHATGEIATQAAGRLAAVYPPGRTTVFVEGESSSAFGAALDAALRRHGFSVTPDDGASTHVSYQLDMMPGEATPTCYLRMKMSDGASFNQIFNIRNGMVVAGAVTQTGLPDVAPVPPPPAMPLSQPAPTEIAAADALAESVEASPSSSPVVPSEPVPAEYPSPAASLPVASATPPPTPSPSVEEPLPADSLPAMPAEPSSSLQKMESEEWTITTGSLKAQLEGWTERAGYQLVWKATHDFQMQSTAVFRDSFVGAMKRLVNRMHLNGNALRVTIYQENRVVEVTED